MDKILLSAIVVMAALSTACFGQIICQSATDASATSSNSGSLPSYSTGPPDAPNSGNCNTWSGYGYSWTPSNWNVKANLTLKYEHPLDVHNITIHGDYDMCWVKMWIKNSNTSEQALLFEGYDNSCTSVKETTTEFTADTVILETCGWSWSATDSVEMCGNTTEEIICGNGIIEAGEECDDNNTNNGDGCSSQCKNETLEAYFAPYMGDIDGSVETTWYTFYNQLLEWHINNSIPSGFSIYPVSMGNQEFSTIIGEIHTSGMIEPILKCEESFNGTLLDNMSYEEAYYAISQCNNAYYSNLSFLGYSNITNLTSYNQRQGRFTNTIRDAVHDLGFKIYFEQYVSEYGYIEMLPDFDITQYSVSLTISGHPGPNETFKQPEEMIQEIIDFNHSHMIYINGTKVIPMLSHQQDFRVSETSSAINPEKWNNYTTMLLMAENDSRIRLIRPTEIYNARHMPICGNGIIETGEECDDNNTVNWDGCSDKCTTEPAQYRCNYATLAEATEESQGYEAIFSTGAPDSDNICNTEAQVNKSWKKLSWDNPANITLTFPEKVYPNDINVYGDYNLCIDRIWAWKNNSWYTINKKTHNYEDEECTADINLSLINFKTNKIKIKTCDWSWSAIDSVSLCGYNESFPQISLSEPTNEKIINKSENSTMHIPVSIMTDVLSECRFSRDKHFNYSDGTLLSTTDLIEHTYNLTVNSTEEEEEVRLYYKCQNINNGKINPYPIMHKFSIRDLNKTFVEICSWHNCSKGAASISTDDGYHTTIDEVKATCHESLNQEGLKGTFYLAYTKNYTSTDWNLWQEVYGNGHEIGGHMANCSYGRNETDYKNDIESNRNDLIGNISMYEDELISFAWPCGVNTEEYKQWISEYYLHTRGYHINQFEENRPKDIFNLKSFNSFGFGTNPPDFYLLADTAQNNQDWVNYVYHDYCDNTDIFRYIKEKDLWIDTIGKTSKYIEQRNSLNVGELKDTTHGVKFNITNNLTNPINRTIYDEEISISVFLPQDTIEEITIDGNITNHTTRKIANHSYALFNINPDVINEIEVKGLYGVSCTDNDSDNYYIEGGACGPIDCNDNDSSIHPNGNETTCNGIDNDCDNQTDEDYIPYNCGIGSCMQQSVCTNGTENCTQLLPQPEACDGEDNDCNGITDDNLSAPLCENQLGVCNGSFKTCTGAGGWSLCNATNYGPDYQESELSCSDILDNDCDSLVDYDDPSCNSTVCMYATSATADSESLPGSKAQYASGEPDAPQAGSCNIWSGNGVNWAPQNWDVTATLTLYYDTPVNASNLTIIGDYDMCWRTMTLRNNATGDQKQIFNGYDENCISTKQLGNDFIADTVMLKTCGWAWSATDAVQLCGNIQLPVCGNGINETGEECDDGNTISGDGCSSTCRIELLNCTDNDSDNYYIEGGACGPIDCNDNDSSIQPNGNETTCNGIDNDCDNQTDEDYIPYNCGIGSCMQQSVCTNGTENCTQLLPQPEACDGEDNDCNGITDDNLSAPLCENQLGVCNGSKKTCGGTSGWSTCNATNYGQDYQFSESSCSDILDNDCDGKIDYDDPDCNSTICMYAKSATADSEYSQGSKAEYASGEPDAPQAGSCSSWSGFGYTWTPQNWDVTATLTLYYDTPVNASNFTIIGDYDMCWRTMILRNNATGEQKQVFNGYDENCISTKQLENDFIADTIMLKTCGWAWSATDAVQLCGSRT